MALPQQPNTTCDIYRSGNSPPAAPDVAGVACYLDGSYQRRLDVGEADSAALRFTHILRCALETDVRDAYDLGTIGATFDTVYVPDQNGTAFKVVFVERVGYGTPNDHKRVYLDRDAPSWPTSYL
jgi:hypothetical protein